MLRKPPLLSALAFAIVATFVSAQATTPIVSNDSRDADRAIIRANIESICQAFIDGDIDKIYATHSEDWRGFLDNTRVPIRGIDEYMRANGITWPRPANATKPTPNSAPGTVGFKVFDFDVNFYSPELAVACFMVDFGRKSGSDLVTTNRLRIMDVYAKRNGNWIQVASHTVVDPSWRAERASTPANVSPQAHQQILDAREAVWKAYFSNDRAALEKLIPDETIAIDEGSEAWSNRASILAGAQKFADSGAKLVSLEFPKTEMQVYGNTIILYTTYLYEIEANGKRSTSHGRGTEIFVRRNNTFVNVGWHLDSGK
jgi:ketosteroid isomerase-like protein